MKGGSYCKVPGIAGFQSPYLSTPLAFGQDLLPFLGLFSEKTKKKCHAFGELVVRLILLGGFGFVPSLW